MFWVGRGIGNRVLGSDARSDSAPDVVNLINPLRHISVAAGRVCDLAEYFRIVVFIVRIEDSTGIMGRYSSLTNFPSGVKTISFFGAFFS